MMVLLWITLWECNMNLLFGNFNRCKSQYRIALSSTSLQTSPRRKTLSHFLKKNDVPSHNKDANFSETFTKSFKPTAMQQQHFPENNTQLLAAKPVPRWLNLFVSAMVRSSGKFLTVQIPLIIIRALPCSHKLRCYLDILVIWTDVISRIMINFVSHRR